MHRNRLPWTDGNRQAAIAPDREPENTIIDHSTTARSISDVRRSFTSPQTRRAVDDVAVSPHGQACRECRAPCGICVVDGHETKRAYVPAASAFSATRKVGVGMYRGQRRSVGTTAKPSV